MAQLESKRGIRCDKCHLILIEKFVYYSYDLIETHVYNNMAPSELRINRNNKVHSLDLCENCHKEFTKRVLINNTIFQNKKRRGRADCELTGQAIADGQAFIVFITSIDVNLVSKAVLTDTNYLSFLISPTVRSEFDINPVPSKSSTWESLS